MIKQKLIEKCFYGIKLIDFDFKGEKKEDRYSLSKFKYKNDLKFDNVLENFVEKITQRAFET